MPHARCTKADQTRTVVTSEAIEVPASRRTPAAVPSRPGSPPGRGIMPPGHGAEPRLATEARLAAELAEARPGALEPQRAILPLHDEAFDLPGLRHLVRDLPASKAGRVRGGWS